MEELMTYEELYNHASAWVLGRGFSPVIAGEYAEWYAAEYPNGEKSHLVAFDYWHDHVRRP